MLLGATGHLPQVLTTFQTQLLLGERGVKQQGPQPRPWPRAPAQALPAPWGQWEPGSRGDRLPPSGRSRPAVLRPAPQPCHCPRAGQAARVPCRAEPLWEEHAAILDDTLWMPLARPSHGGSTAYCPGALPLETCVLGGRRRGGYRHLVYLQSSHTKPHLFLV